MVWVHDDEHSQNFLSIPDSYTPEPLLEIMHLINSKRVLLFVALLAMLVLGLVHPSIADDDRDWDDNDDRCNGSVVGNVCYECYQNCVTNISTQQDGTVECTCTCDDGSTPQCNVRTDDDFDDFDVFDDDDVFDDK